VGSVENRLRRLEDEGRRGSCPGCNLPPEGPGYIVLIDERHPETSFNGDPEERCGRCERLLYQVIKVVYEGVHRRELHR
jgi:hypothetical protein